MIKKETILSNYDKKLTLLQWLKQVQGQLKDLKDKGVKAVVEEFDTPEAFYNAYSTKPSGTPVLAIVADDTAIMGTLSEITDKLILKGTIYQGGKMYTHAEADSLSIVGSGELVNIDELNSAKILYFNSEQEFYNHLKSHTYKNGDQFCFFIDGKYWILFIGNIDYVWNDLYFNLNGYGLSYNDGFAMPIMFYVNPYVKVEEYSSGPSVQFVSTYEALMTGMPESQGLFSPRVPNSKFYQFGRLYGWRKTDNNHKIYVIGGSNNSNTTLQGIAIDETNKEIYYGLNGYMKVSSSGVVENAISGTQLKEAVRLANQKTYWHTIRLHNSGTLSDVNITIVIPSHSNNPVARVEDLLAIGAGDIWGCSGTIATTESALPIVTFDAVKFGSTADATIFSGTLGRTYTLTQLIAKSLEYEDNVKEVK